MTWQTVPAITSVGRDSILVAVRVIDRNIARVSRSNTPTNNCRSRHGRRSRSRLRSESRGRSRDMPRGDRIRYRHHRDGRSRSPRMQNTTDIQNTLNSIMNRLTSNENSCVTGVPNKTIARCDPSATCNVTEGELNTSQSNVSRCYTPELHACTHDTRTTNGLSNTHTFTPQVNNSETNMSESTRGLVDALNHCNQLGHIIILFQTLIPQFTT